MGYINIIKASAGSGKTYTLARTYIANLIGVPTGKSVTINNKEYEQFKLRTSTGYHRHILAITFTNKATNEMKVRIITQLYKLSKGEGDFVDDFKIMFPDASSDDVTKAAGNALCEILFDYDSFNVSTIDAFFQRILRNFAKELDRDYNYGLELDADYALGVAVNDFLNDLGGNSKGQTIIDDWVRKFIASSIDNDNSWDFFGYYSGKLKMFSKIIFKEFFMDRYQPIINYLSDQGNGNGLSRVSKFKEALITHRNLRNQSFLDTPDVIRNFLNKHGINATDINSKSPIYKFASGNDDPIKSSSSIKTLKKYAQADDALHDNVLKKGPPKDRLSIDEANEFKNILEQAFRHLEIAEFLDKTNSNIWNLGLLGKIIEKLDKFRRDTNSIMISDTNELISRVLNSGASFIYEHAGNVLHKYMIDEFQDTSHKQYDNFKPLLNESIASANEDLIIGDEKQSIYRFRNSDPSILRDEISNDFDVHSTTLFTNYRSYPAIVNFNNAFFEHIINDYSNEMPQLQSLKLTYSNIKQEIFKTQLPGYVCLHAVPVQPSRSNSTKSANDLIVKALPLYINDIRRRGIALRDIAILVNTKKEGNEIIEHLLQYNNSLSDNNHNDHIDVISAESLLLKNSPSVRLIISVLQFLDITQYHLKETADPNESADTKAEGKVPFQEFIKKRVKEQRHYKLLHDFETKIQSMSSDADMGETLLNCFNADHELSNDQQLKQYAQITKEIMPNPQCELTSLVNIVDKIIDKYILPSASQQPHTKKLENSFLLAFMNLVLDFSKRHNGGTVREFLQYWKNMEKNLAVSSPSDANAVNVMTIHKSKGLEFKCIIIPFVNWKLIKLDNELWIKKEDWLQCNELNDLSNDTDIVPPLIPTDPASLKKSSLLTSIINNEEECSLIDNLNKLYVALTRPKQELHVFAPIINNNFDALPNSQVSDIEDAATLLLKFAKSNVGNGLNFELIEHDIDCWNETTTTAQGENDTNGSSSTQMHTFSYYYGKPSTCNEQNTHQDSDSSMPDYYVNSRTMPVNVSSQTNKGTIMAEGVRMHELLGMVRNFDDFNFAMTHGIENGLFTGNHYWTAKRFKSLIKTIAADEKLRCWFDSANTIYNERSISQPTGDGSVELHRPDRIVRRPDGTIIVVDYKFGVKTDAGTIARHSAQVRKYITLLQHLGYENIEGYVWYARSNKVITVDPNKLDWLNLSLNFDN